MGRGRPLGTERRNIIHRILSVIKTSYSYEIWRIMQTGYRETSTIQRDVYYNVDKGIELGLWSPKKIIVENQNSWDGFTGRRLLTIKEKCKVDNPEKQMILDVTYLVRKTIESYKELKRDYKLGRVLPFKHYLEIVMKEEGKRLKLLSID